MTAAFVWFEYVSKDDKKAQGFFGELFGWTTKDVPMPDGAYTMIASGGKTIGGYMHTPPGAPSTSHWLTHLRVSDVRAASEKVTQLGGKVLEAPFKVGDFGTMAIASDPHGGAFALWQPAKADEPLPEAADGSFCWNELTSKVPAASVAFYSAVAGFTPEKMDMPGMGTYFTLNAAGQPRGGILEARMPEAQHAWTPYVQVASTDKTIERAKKLGATVIVLPTDVPTVGRFAIILDPQGAALGILQP
ncbi:MAG: VOC family protein [Kofleriaceae bacterium]|nr:VOC family protein [Kofleriaceae bacterium]